MKAVRLLYFASVREAIGLSEEQRHVPPSVTTPAALIDWLANGDDRYAAAFTDHTKLRCAIDRQMVKLDASLDEAHEVAFFPPVTGG